MLRVAIFGSACTTGWAFAYDADEETQRRISELAEKYNSMESWQSRNNDGSVTIYDSVEDTIATHNTEQPECPASDLQDIFNFYIGDAGDGCGAVVPASEIERMLIEDPMNEGWLSIAAWPLP